MTPTPKPTIAEIEPYRPGKSQAHGVARVIKLSANENALGCSPAARRAFVEAASSLHFYPDSRAAKLREALAARHDIDSERIVLGAGSDEIFSLACQAYLSPGDVMVQPRFAFAAWAIAARAAGAHVVSAPEREYAVDVDAMLACVDARTRMVFVANPASPTGTSIPFADIERLHAGLPEHVILILDGAYAEFADFDAACYWRLAGAPNVILTRTFSKLYGLATLRVGWGYCPKPVADALNRIRLPFNVSAPAQAAAIAALEDAAFTARSIEHAKAGRARLAATLTEMGFVALPATANFVTLRVPDAFRLSAADIDRGLAERGVLVRALDNYGMPDCLRVTVGDDAAMSAFDAALRSLLGA
ncbi:MAG: histidinol-phosphate transaminase [Hyphomonadaceae bacterium]|nr:histidinol-phosphate transaminase [Hyphomonadaceae bacterium]